MWSAARPLLLLLPLTLPLPLPPATDLADIVDIGACIAPPAFALPGGGSLPCQDWGRARIRLATGVWNAACNNGREEEENEKYPDVRGSRQPVKRCA